MKTSIPIEVETREIPGHPSEFRVRFHECGWSRWNPIVFSLAPNEFHGTVIIPNAAIAAAMKEAKR